MTFRPLGFPFVRLLLSLSFFVLAVIPAGKFCLAC